MKSFNQCTRNVRYFCKVLGQKCGLHLKQTEIQLVYTLHQAQF